MSLQTPNRIHASAVCFWELIAAAPPDPQDLYSVGFQSRHNFSAITLDPDDAVPNDPEEIQLTMVQPIGKNEAVAFVRPDVRTDRGSAGISIGRPLVSFGSPFFDDAAPDTVNIAELFPPARLTGAGGGVVGDRANFYVMVLGVPPSPEEVSPVGTQ